jgi:tellurite methyltransferase
MNHSIEFFDRQFRRQAEGGEYALNPFERAVLPHLKGEVLDLGSGLGNLAFAAAQAGCHVTALDASPNGIEDLARRARAAGVRVDAQCAELRHYEATRQFDCVVCIGLLMFFRCDEARAVISHIRNAVRPGGIAAINVLTEGTTYMAMFDASGHCLFGRDDLTVAFADWDPVLYLHEDFPAPDETVKAFHTLIARRPA